MAAGEVRAGRAFVELFSKDQALSKGLRAASAKIKAWAASAQKSLHSAGQGLMTGGGFGMLAGGSIVTAITASAQAFADAGDRIEKMSQRTGFSAEALSELGHAAKLCGTDLETVEKSVHKMQTLMLEAGNGSEEANAKLSALGLSFQKMQGLTPEKQFESLVESIHRLPEADRAAAVIDVFGKNAASLIPLVNAGTSEIIGMREEAKRLGISMSSKDAASAAAYTDALTRLKEAFHSIFVQIGAAVAPELTSLAEIVTKNIAAFIKWIRQNKAFILTVLKIAAAVAAVSAGVVAIGAVIFGLGTVAGAVFGAIATAISLVSGLISFLASPIGLVIAGVAAMLLYFVSITDSIDWLKKQFTSLFSVATKAWGGITNAIAAGRIDLAFKVAGTAIKLVWMDVTHFLYKKWKDIQMPIMDAWDTTIYTLSSLLIKGMAGIQKCWNNTVTGFKAVWLIFANSMQSTWSYVTTGFMNAWDSAYTFVAKRLAWVAAKVKLQDASQMMKEYDDALAERTKKRNQEYTEANKAREKRQEEAMANVGQENIDKNDKLKQDRNDTLQNLKDDFAQKQKDREESYNKDIEDMQRQRKEAEKAFNDSVNEAAEARSMAVKDKVYKRKEAAVQEAAAEVEKKSVNELKRTTSSSGTFNAMAIQLLQSQNPMDRIAKNTEETAKYVKKTYEKRYTPAVVS